MRQANFPYSFLTVLQDQQNPFFQILCFFKKTGREGLMEIPETGSAKAMPELFLKKIVYRL